MLIFLIYQRSLLSVFQSTSYNKQRGTSMDLLESRKEIDEIDQQIVELFERRMEVAKEVASYKISTGKKVFDKKREQEKIKAVQALVHNEFNWHGIRELFLQIMSMSRKLQYSMLPIEEETEPFQKIKKLDLEGKRVVCFGEKGSFTEQAMEEYFGSEIEYFNVLTFKEVMEALKDKRADFGVLPIENSSTGGITDIYDLLVEYDHYLIGEHVVKVDQALLALPGAKIEELKRVYSHPQGILQCASYLEEHNWIQTEEYLSTASSAKKVLEEHDLTQGAIASVRAAKYYGLDVLEECINYESNNSTRFIIISNEKCYFENANKVSIWFELPHESGTLYNMLSHFIYNNLNLTKIESRPISGKNWEYRFFVEFEGNLAQPGVENAWKGIKEEASHCRILGNFQTK